MNKLAIYGKIFNTFYNMGLVMDKANVKRFLKTKHHHLLFDGLFVEDYYNLNTLLQSNPDKYSYISNDKEMGEFGFVRIKMNFVLVNDKEVAEQTKDLEINPNDLIAIISIPVFIPTLNKQLNFFHKHGLGEESELNNYDSIHYYLLNTIDNNDNQYQEIINSVKKQIDNFAFFFIEREEIQLYQYNPMRKAQFVEPNISEKDRKHLAKGIKDKLNAIENKTSFMALVDLITKVLLEHEILCYLLRVDLGQLEENANLDDFLLLSNIENTLSSGNNYYPLKSKDMREMAKERFIACMRKQFDMSWIMKEVNNEMNLEADFEARLASLQEIMEAESQA